MAEDGDEYWVPRDLMEKLYLYDDRDAFVRYLRDRNTPVFVVNNEADGEEHLRALVEELFGDLF